tara:strand:- start:462 stop:2825 length:2364 start_codon:yes stop_codon:yes gene_type:complete
MTEITNNFKLTYNFKNKNFFNYKDDIKIKIYYKDKTQNIEYFNIQIINKIGIELIKTNPVIVNSSQTINFTDYFQNNTNCNLYYRITGDSDLYQYINTSNISINYHYPDKDYTLTVYATNNINICFFNIIIKEKKYPKPKIKQQLNFFQINNLNEYFESGLSDNTLTYHLDNSSDFITLNNSNLFVNKNLFNNSNIHKKINFNLTVIDNIYNVSNIFSYDIEQKPCIFNNTINSVEFNNLSNISINLNQYIVVPENNKYYICNITQNHNITNDNDKYFYINSNILTLIPDYRDTSYDITITTKNTDYDYEHIFNINIIDNTFKNNPIINQKEYYYKNINKSIDITTLFQYENNITYNYYIQYNNKINSYLENNSNLLDIKYNSNIAIIYNSNLEIFNHFRNNIFYFNLYIEDTNYHKYDYITYIITETDPIIISKNFENIIKEKGISKFNLNEYFSNLTSKIIDYNIIYKYDDNININESNLIITHNKYKKYEITINATIAKFNNSDKQQTIIIDETIKIDNYLNSVPTLNKITIKNNNYNLKEYYLLDKYNYVLRYRINKFEYYDVDNYIYLLNYNNSNITYNYDNQIFNTAFINVKYKFINSNIQNIIHDNSNIIKYNNDYFYFNKINHNFKFLNNYTIDIKHIQKKNFVQINNDIINFSNLIPYIFPNKFEIITNILYNTQQSDILPRLIDKNITFKFDQSNMNQIKGCNIINDIITDNHYKYNLLDKYNYLDYDYSFQLSNITCNISRFIDNNYLIIDNNRDNQQIQYKINNELTFYLIHSNL